METARIQLEIRKLGNDKIKVLSSECPVLRACAGVANNTTIRILIAAVAGFGDFPQSPQFSSVLNVDEGRETTSAYSNYIFGDGCRKKKNRTVVKELFLSSTYY
ncbi:uncharacterized protein LOC125570138 [Nematostella vectensis]|uniref:uncharacterized protein LOC125570138 n=1 Tax=Nematostella vectensis TaxID=45351 RepID=UPI00207738EC|nr:uncharacterized protein LOC125570138 [Nematostella vectensis]